MVVRELEKRGGAEVIRTVSLLGSSPYQVLWAVCGRFLGVLGFGAGVGVEVDDILFVGGRHIIAYVTWKRERGRRSKKRAETGSATREGKRR
jgi:hypothetical protein